MSPVLVVLAAGASQRLGRTKALVDLGGATPLQRICAAASCVLDRSPLPALVVAGAAQAEIAAQLPARCQLVANLTPEAGRTGSVQCALRWAAGHDVCLAPVDVPLVPAEVYAALLDAWMTADAPAFGWLAPRHRATGRYGHPIVVGRGLLEVLSTWTPAQPLHTLRAQAQPLLAVEVDTERICDDLDTPADLAHLQQLALNLRL